MDPADAEAITNYLRDRSYPVGYSKDQKRMLRFRRKYYFLKENTLFHFREKSELTRFWTKEDFYTYGQKVVIGGAEKLAIMEFVHSDVGGRHFGRDKTIRKVIDRFYWKGIVQDVREFVKTCETCQLSNPPNRPNGLNFANISTKASGRRFPNTASSRQRCVVARKKKAQDLVQYCNLPVQTSSAERFRQFCANNDLKTNSQALDLLLDTVDDLGRFVDSRKRSSNPVKIELLPNGDFCSVSQPSLDAENNDIQYETILAPIVAESKYLYRNIKKNENTRLLWETEKICLANGQLALLVLKSDFDEVDMKADFAVFEIRNTVQNCSINLHAETLLDDLTTATDIRLEYQTNWKLSSSLEKQFTILKHITKRQSVQMGWTFNYIFDDFEEKLIFVKYVKVGGVAEEHGISCGSIIKTITGHRSDAKIDFSSIEISTLDDILKSCTDFVFEFVKLVPLKTHSSEICQKKRRLDDSCQNDLHENPGISGKSVHTTESGSKMYGNLYDNLLPDVKMENDDFEEVSTRCPEKASHASSSFKTGEEDLHGVHEKDVKTSQMPSDNIWTFFGQHI